MMREGLFDHLEDITDPRAANARHKLMDIIVITICAVTAGAEAWEHIEEYAQTRQKWLKEFLELPRGIPSHDTFARVFSAIDPKQFQKSFLDWVKTLRKASRGEFLAIDGKTVRRSHDRANGHEAIHLVSAWAAQNKLVLGQLRVEDKANEITAIPTLLDLLDLKGCLVTIDAIGCQTRIAEKIVENGADYVLAVKDNQPTLCEDLRLFFEDAVRLRFEDMQVDYHETVDGEHGRIETRRYWITSDIDWLEGKQRWPGLNSLGMVEREREINGEVSRQKAYYIASIPRDARRFAAAVRSHWGIENSLHWVLDVTFREDECRIRKNHAPENIAVIRRMVMNLLKQDTKSKLSLKVRRMKCMWDHAYLEKTLGL